MNEYSYADIMRMQEEAKQRVLEMKKRSRSYVENSTEEKKGSSAKDAGSGIPERPRTISYPVEYDLPKNSRAVDNGKKSAQKERGLSAALDNIFGNMSGEETERMFILSLCLLLVNENCDDELIMSLMYILT